MQHTPLHEWVIVHVVSKCFPRGKFLFDKCSCIPIKLRKTPEFNISQYVCIFESCKSSSMVLCCHLLKLFIQLYLPWMQTYVGPGGRRSYCSDCVIRMCCRTACAWRFETFIIKTYYTAMCTSNMNCAGLMIFLLAALSCTQSEWHPPSAFTVCAV